jgi:hypothetical protein
LHNIKSRPSHKLYLTSSFNSINIRPSIARGRRKCAHTLPTADSIRGPSKISSKIRGLPNEESASPDSLCL